MSIGPTIAINGKKLTMRMKPRIPVLNLILVRARPYPASAPMNTDSTVTDRQTIALLIKG